MSQGPESEPADARDAPETEASAEPDAAGAAQDVAASAAGLAVGAALSSVATPIVGKVAGAAVTQVARSRAARRGVQIWMALAAVGLTMILVPVVGTISAVSVILHEGAEESRLAEAEPEVDSCATNVGGTTLSAEQMDNARVIVTTTIDERGLNARDAVIAVMTAMTESSLINVEHGDEAGPDSRGLFQQRDGWGPLEVRMDPAGATGLFLNSLTNPDLKTFHAVGDTRNGTLINDAEASRHEKHAPWIVAQSVQRSFDAEGANYMAKYATAVATVATITGEQVPVYAGPGALDGVDGASGTTRCDSGPAGDAAGPGAWGGHTNGEIPLEELCAISWAPHHHLRCDAAGALENMSAAYKAKFGVNISITDAYRDRATQEVLWVTKPGLAAKPGTSNHGWGLALDLGGGINTWGTDVRSWMVDNAPGYGWFSPRWAQPGMGKEEPWHWEFGDSGY